VRKKAAAIRARLKVSMLGNWKRNEELDNQCSSLFLVVLTMSSLRELSKARRQKKLLGERPDERAD
jgi:hypothetical protein